MPLRQPPSGRCPTPRSNFDGDHRPHLGPAHHVHYDAAQHVMYCSVRVLHTAEWVEIYRTSRAEVSVFTDCIDWSLEFHTTASDEPGQTCRWNVDEGYIQVWLKQNGFVMRRWIDGKEDMATA